MNQSKLEVITGSWRKARENARERVTIGFSFTSDFLFLIGWKTDASFFLGQVYHNWGGE